MFDESTLVLEGVTLGQMVELMVEVLVDLAGGTVLDEETTEDSEAAHPEDLAVDTRVSTPLFITKLSPAIISHPSNSNAVRVS